MNHRYALAVLPLLAVTACGEPLPTTTPDDTRLEAGSYSIGRSNAGADSTVLALYEGVVVSTNWDNPARLIYLGPDAVREPLLSMYVTLGSIPDAGGQAVVAEAIVTTSRVKVGTGPEIDGRSYNLVQGRVVGITVGPNYIKGTLDLTLERILIHPEDQPETIRLGGPFTAVAK